MTSAAAPRRISKKVISLTQKLERMRNGPASIALPPGLRALELTFAMRNKDYGARKFLKYDVPSLVYANPALQIKQNRPERVENPTLVMQFDNGSTRTMSLKMKNSDLIREEFKELVRAAFATPAAGPSTSSPPSPSPSTASSPAPPEQQQDADKDKSAPTPATAEKTSEPILPTDSGESSGGKTTAGQRTAGAPEAGADNGTARE